jgi:hypothetical protein
MGRFGIALLAAATVLVAASARAQSEQRVLAPTVFSAHALPANAITGFIVSCRSGYVATSGGVARPAQGVTLVAITPVGDRAYRFRFGNPVGNGRKRVTVAVACRRLSGGASYKLRLALPRPLRLTASAGKTAGAGFACPSGTVPVGAGADLDPGRSFHAYRGGLRLSIRRETSTLSRFSVSVQNAGSRARTVVLYGSCVTLARAKGAPRLRLHVEVSTFTAAVGAANQTFARRCRRGWFSLAAGFAARSRLTRVEGAIAVGAGGRWTAANDADTSAPVGLQLTCARLGP